MNLPPVPPLKYGNVFISLLGSGLIAGLDFKQMYKIEAERHYKVTFVNSEQNSFEMLISI